MSETKAGRMRWIHRNGEGVEFCLNGPPQPHAHYTIYLRVQDKAGNYIGALEGRALVGLAKRLQRYVLAGRAARVLARGETP